jgi:formylglycine-generating enzyme required for sulfatase activity
MATAYGFGNEPADLRDYAWFEGNSDRKAHSVGLKKPNLWGLYDMHGNVSEWCEDRYRDYPQGSLVDPQGPSSGALRVSRGGSWRSEPAFCRSGERDGFLSTFRCNYFGFRVALSIQSKIPESSP